LRAVGLAIDERKRETTTRRLEDLEFELLFEILVATLGGGVRSDE